MYQRRINWLTSIQVAIILGTTLLAFSPSLQAQDRPKGTPSDPVYARDLDTASRKPYQGQGAGTFLDDRDYNYVYDLYFDRSTVLPINASMVIEYASGVIHLPKGVTPLLRLVTDESGEHYFNLAPQGEAEGFVHWVFSQPVRMYASRGSRVRCYVTLLNLPDKDKRSGIIKINVSGYKEYAPLVVLGGPVVIH